MTSASLLLAATLLLAPVLACSGQAAPPSPSTPTPAAAPAAAPKEAPVAQESQGPALSDPAALLAWFEGAGKDKRVRLPIVMTPDPLGISDAFIGTTAGPAPKGAVQLKLDDTGMSVGLADRMGSDCPYDVPCVIWVEGFWGATLSGGPDLGGPGLGGPALPGLDAEPTRHPFSVRDYKGVVKGAATHVVVIE